MSPLSSGPRTPAPNQDLFENRTLASDLRLLAPQIPFSEHPPSPPPPPRPPSGGTGPNWKIFLHLSSQQTWEIPIVSPFYTPFPKLPLPLLAQNLDWGKGGAEAGLDQTPNSPALLAGAGGLCLWRPIVWTNKLRPQAAGLDAPNRLFMCLLGLPDLLPSFAGSHECLCQPPPRSWLLRSCSRRNK